MKMAEAKKRERAGALKVGRRNEKFFKLSILQKKPVPLVSSSLLILMFMMTCLHNIVTKKLHLSKLVCCLAVHSLCGEIFSDLKQGL